MIKLKFYLLFIPLYLVMLNNLYGQQSSFCTTSNRINNSTSIGEIDAHINEYLDGILGNNIGEIYLDEEGNFLQFESPFGGYDGSGMKVKLIKEVTYIHFGRYITPFKRTQTNIIQARKSAIAIVDFFSNVCDIVYTDDVNIKYFKIMSKVLEYGSGASFIGPYGFIIELVKVYVDASIAAIKAINRARNSYARQLYYYSDLEIILSIKNLEDYDDFIKKTSFLLIDDQPNERGFKSFGEVIEYGTQLEVVVDNHFSEYGKVIRVKIPAGLIKDPSVKISYALKIKIGSNINTVYIPLNEAMPYIKEGTTKYVVKLKKEKKDSNIQFTNYTIEQ